MTSVNQLPTDADLLRMEEAVRLDKEADADVLDSERLDSVPPLPTTSDAPTDERSQIIDSQPTSPSRRGGNGQTREQAQKRTASTAKQGRQRAASLKPVWVGGGGKVAISEVRKQLQDMFQKYDESQDAMLDKKEFVKLIRESKMSSVAMKKMKKQDISEVFKRFSEDSSLSNERDEHEERITFNQFTQWYMEELKGEVRRARLMARQLFTAADEDESRSLDKQELHNVYKKLRQQFPSIVLDPPFNLDRDFEEMARQTQELREMEPHREDEEEMERRSKRGTLWQLFTAEDEEEMEYEVNAGPSVLWEVFEAWWRKVSGDDEGTVPVLPEGMTEQTNRLVSNGHGAAAKGWSDAVFVANMQKGGTQAWQARWNFLKPRLMMLIDLQGVWGVIGDIYGANATIYSREEEAAHSKRPFIRSPGEWVYWDLAHLFAISYVLLVIPMRVGFDEDAELYSFSFCLEAALDFFFICDMVSEIVAPAPPLTPNSPATLRRSTL